jgi:hypothetical protein
MISKGERHNKIFMVPKKFMVAPVSEHNLLFTVPTMNLVQSGFCCAPTDSLQSLAHPVLKRYGASEFATPLRNRKHSPYH